MRLRKGRKDADTAEQPKSTIGDVGLGKYGPDDTKERPVSRFERPRVTKRRSDAQHKA